MRGDKGTARRLSLIQALLHLVGIKDPDEKQQKTIRSVRRELHIIQEGFQPEYYPRRKKFKGYQRENRRYSFNKNR